MAQFLIKVLVIIVIGSPKNGTDLENLGVWLVRTDTFTHCEDRKGFREALVDLVTKIWDHKALEKREKEAVLVIDLAKKYFNDLHAIEPDFWLACMFNIEPSLIYEWFNRIEDANLVIKKPEVRARLYSFFLRRLDKENDPRIVEFLSEIEKIEDIYSNSSEPRLMFLGHSALLHGCCTHLIKKCLNGDYQTGKVYYDACIATLSKIKDTLNAIAALIESKKSTEDPKKNNYSSLVETADLLFTQLLFSTGNDSHFSDVFLNRPSPKCYHTALKVWELNFDTHIESDKETEPEVIRANWNLLLNIVNLILPLKDEVLIKKAVNRLDRFLISFRKKATEEALYQYVRYILVEISPYSSKTHAHFLEAVIIIAMNHGNLKITGSPPLIHFITGGLAALSRLDFLRFADLGIKFWIRINSDIDLAKEELSGLRAQFIEKLIEASSPDHPEQKSLLEFIKRSIEVYRENKNEGEEEIKRLLDLHAKALARKG